MDFQNDTDEMFAVESMEDYEPINLDDLEAKLDEELENSLNDLELLKEQKDIIENPVALGEVVKDVIWEQVCNQIGIKQGKDFIAENHGNTLDLRNEAHIQTTENFAKGKIATHNDKIDYQQRYDDWQSNFKKDENGKIITHETRTGKQEATLVKGARAPFDKDRPAGSKGNNTDIDHTVSAGEIIRDPEANAHLSKEEQVAFANSDENLNEMDSNLNRSKGDKSMDDWLEHPNSNGQKPEEIFPNLDEKEKKRLKAKDKEAREEYKKVKDKGKERSIKTGRQSQKEEAFRITKTAVRAVVLQMLADLVKTMISKLVEWFRQKGKNFKTLLHSIKDAIHLFVCDLKNEVLTAGGTLATTIATAIFGPIVGIFKKIGMLLKQGWNSLKEAFSYLKSPKTKNQPFSITVLEVGKIIMAGLSVTGALALGEVIEKGLMTIPIFVFEIPLFGSLANILGIFFGAIVAGIIGAIVLNWIDRLIEKKIMRENIDAQIKKGNEILNLQHQIQVVGEAKLERTKSAVANNIRNRHVEAANTMKDSFENIKANCAIDRSIQDTFNDIDVLFDKLED